ncbi:hypothetical protein WDU94_002192 [Cyamophila willieti]
MILKQTIVLFCLYEFVISWNDSDNDCCIELYDEPKYRGRERPTEWTHYESVPNVELYSKRDCKGNDVLIKRYSAECYGDNLGEEPRSWYMAGKNCGNFDMNKKAVSLHIYHSSLPYPGRPVTDYNVKLLFGDNTPLDEILKKNIRSDESLGDLCKTCKLVIHAGEAVPYADQFATVLSVIFELAERENWRKDLINTIPEVTYHESARQLGTHIKTSLDLVIENTKKWNDSSATPHERSSRADTIYNELFRVLDLMKQNIDPLYNRFPAFAVKPMFSLCTSMTFFLPRMPKWKSADLKLIPLYKELVNHFRYPLMKARLDKMTTVNGDGARWVDQIKNLPYNTDGYIHREARLFCLNRKCHSGHDVQCLKDEVTPEDVYSHSGNVYQCFTGYARLVRSRFEEAYDRSCNLTLAA